MNDTVMQGPLALGRRRGSGKAPVSGRRKSATFYWYSLLTLLVMAGWLMRDRQLLNPEEGAGYWLGITGGSLMLVLLLYPLRKRLRIMRRLGPTSVWFRIHMILGLVGPLLILYHCNFRLGSFNSRVAFYSMLLVAISGLIGRHFYARIHHGLYGKKASLQELQKALSEAAEQSRGMTMLMPKLLARLKKMSDDLQGCHLTQSISAGRSLRWTLTNAFVQMSLIYTGRRELQLAVASGRLERQDYPRARLAATRYIRNYTNLMGRVAQFSVYERMFALWHIFHLPIFFMMVITALFHVLAVHMY